MTTFRDGLLIVGLVLQLYLVVAGFQKRNLRINYSFYIYLVTSFVSTVAISYVIQEVTVIRSFYKIKEFILDALKTAILFEFNHRVFRYYPRVQQSNYGFFVLALLGLGLYLWLVPAEEGAWWGTGPLDVHSKIMQANCFLFMVFAGSILFYRLHIDERQKLLLIGSLISQFPLAFGFAIMAALGAPARVLGSRANSAFFVIALLIWAKVYWKNDSVDHTRLASNSGLGRPLGSGAPQ
jgi:hypothetical protein